MVGDFLNSYQREVIYLQVHSQKIDVLKTPDDSDIDCAGDVHLNYHDNIKKQNKICPCLSGN